MLLDPTYFRQAGGIRPYLFSDGGKPDPIVKHDRASVYKRLYRILSKSESVRNRSGLEVKNGSSRFAGLSRGLQAGRVLEIQLFR